MANIDKIILKGTNYTIVDSTVPSWAKQPSKPTYTAAEVGALPNTTVIPTKTSQLNNDSGFLTSHQDISGKQDTLISGTNIKTINSESILGNGNIITGSKIYVGRCSTLASQSTKVVTTESFPTSGGKPLTGTLIAVFFSETDTSSSSYTYLNVNSTGAIKIMYGNGSFASGKNIRYTGISNVYTIYMYNGTYWRWITTALENLNLSGFGYATQNNSSASSSITATLPNYTQMQDGIVCVKFTYDVPANSTLNINSTGTRNIKHKGSNITAGIIKAGDLVTFVYNNGYQILAIDSSYTKAEIDSMIGNIETLLESI